MSVLLKGSDLKEVKLFKILNAELKHHDHQYTEGLNVLRGEFCPMGTCQAGGLYVTDEPHRYIFFGTLIAPVTLPDDARVWVTPENRQYKVDKLILGKWIEISEDIYLKSIKIRWTFLQFVPKHRRSLAVCLAAVRKDEIAMALVPNAFVDQVRDMADFPE